MYGLTIIFFISFLITFLSTPWLISKLQETGIVGKDMNKKDNPEVPEMGGFSIIFGFSAGIMLAIGLSSFTAFWEIKTSFILASLSTVLLMTLVGIFDDLFAINQFVKAALPLFAALPLAAVQVGTTNMIFPFLGEINFGIFYPLILVPVGIAGASNVTNMLAGFNGLEAGMGLIGCGSLTIIALKVGSLEAAILLFCTAGPLVAFLYFNWYPSKILMGDIGTLFIGAIIASAVIIGNFETAGIIIILPYALDFFIKAVNRFPSSNWWGEWREGKLHCQGKAVGLCQWIMKLSGGISEKSLVLILIGIELFVGIVAILSV